jgi:predicted phosphodiesterase
MSVSWLHVSDFHIGTDVPHDRKIVLKGLIQYVLEHRGKQLSESGLVFRPDLIFVTGDVAYSGRADEYRIATDFFTALCDAAGLTRERIFVVPGNHDVNIKIGWKLGRPLQGELPASARKAQITHQDFADHYFEPDEPLVHIAKQRAFVDWHDHYFEGIRKFPQNSTCKWCKTIDINGFGIAVLLLNSALFCQGGDDDHARLWVGRRCLDDAIEELEKLEAPQGKPEAVLKIALVHHPLHWLHDEERSAVQKRLAKHVNIILRGHLHEPEIERDEVVQIAAGAVYQGGGDAKRALFVSFDGRENITIYPIRYESQTTSWNLDPIFPPPSHTMVSKIRNLAQAPSRNIRKNEEIGELTSIDAKQSFFSDVKKEITAGPPWVGRATMFTLLERYIVDPENTKKEEAVYGNIFELFDEAFDVHDDPKTCARNLEYSFPKIRGVSRSKETRQAQSAEDGLGSLPAATRVSDPKPGAALNAQIEATREKRAQQEAGAA